MIYMKYQMPKTDYDKYYVRTHVPDECFLELLDSKTGIFKRYIEAHIHENFYAHLMAADDEIVRLTRELKQSKIRNILQSLSK